MKAVLHLPVAEQKPSNTAMVSLFASNLISGIFSSKKVPPNLAAPGGEARHLVRRRETSVTSNNLAPVGWLRCAKLTSGREFNLILPWLGDFSFVEPLAN
jgi:hypothetical protein